MENAEINPFDSSKKSLKEAFERLKADPKWVNEVAHWYVGNYEKANSDDSLSLFVGKNVAESVRFPGKLGAFHFLGATGSKNLSEDIAAEINQNPSVCLEVPEVPDRKLIGVNKETKARLKHFLPRGTTSLSGQPKVVPVEELEEQYVAAAAEISRRLGFAPEDLEYDQVAAIAKVMKLSGRFLEDSLYYRFMLDQAAETIVRLAPGLKEVVEEVVEHTLLFKSGRQETEDTSEWGYVQFGKLHGITFHMDFGEDNFDRNHRYRVLVTGHELLHGVTRELLRIPGEAPDFWKSESLDDNEPGEEWASPGQSRTNLLTVLLEGASMAFEHEVLDEIMRYSQDYVEEPISRYGPNRLNYLRRAARAPRSMGFKIEEDIPSQGAAYVYPEGMRLALDLRRNGWSLADLPELAGSVHSIVAEETGSSDPDVYNKVVVNRGNKSVYSKIIGRIRSLKKEEKGA